MNKLDHTPSGDNKHRIAHGATVKYMFKTGTGIVMIGCVYDSEKYASPADQIIDENMEFFLSRADEMKTLSCVVEPVSRFKKINSREVAAIHESFGGYCMN